MKRIGGFEIGPDVRRFLIRQSSAAHFDVNAVAFDSKI
jgi:hypothetical protein